MRSESQANDQTPIAEDLLLVTKDGICKLWMEGGEGLGFLFPGLDYGDMNDAIGVAGP